MSDNDQAAMDTLLISVLPNHTNSKYASDFAPVRSLKTNGHLLFVFNQILRNRIFNIEKLSHFLRTESIDYLFTDLCSVDLHFKTAACLLVVSISDNQRHRMLIVDGQVERKPSIRAAASSILHAHRLRILAGLKVEISLGLHFARLREGDGRGRELLLLLLIGR